jgi:hypothetical protein
MYYQDYERGSFGADLRIRRLIFRNSCPVPTNFIILAGVRLAIRFRRSNQRKNYISWCKLLSYAG